MRQAGRPAFAHAASEAAHGITGRAARDAIRGAARGDVRRAARGDACAATRGVARAEQTRSRAGSPG
ncbi:MAG TPA: hypothetical protein VFO47_01060, partial [Actinomycetes bacterium]|nr:hypothetical protein [Actinomycetes bacterium]